MVFRVTYRSLKGKLVGDNDVAELALAVELPRSQLASLWAIFERCIVDTWIETVSNGRGVDDARFVGWVGFEGREKRREEELREVEVTNDILIGM